MYTKKWSEQIEDSNLIFSSIILFEENSFNIPIYRFVSDEWDAKVRECMYAHGVYFNNIKIWIAPKAICMKFFSRHTNTSSCHVKNIASLLGCIFSIQDKFTTIFPQPSLGKARYYNHGIACQDKS